MTLLYAAQAGLAEHTAKSDRLHYLVAGGKYLHQSGLCLQDGRKYAWQGTIEQARAIRRRSDAAAGCLAISITAVTPTALNAEAV